MPNHVLCCEQQHIINRLAAVLLTTCMALGALTAPSNASGAPKTANPPHAKSKTESQSKKKTGSTKVKHHTSRSEESRQERDKRLTRECRGAPNAGACLGYTRR